MVWNVSHAIQRYGRLFLSSTPYLSLVSIYNVSLTPFTFISTPIPFVFLIYIRALGVLGLGTAATTIFLPEVVFGSFAGLFAGIGSSHQDYRHRRGSGGKLTPGNCHKHLPLLNSFSTSLTHSLNTQRIHSLNSPRIYSLNTSLTPEREHETSNLPFVALISGRQSWTPLLDELKWNNVGLAVATMIPIAMRQMKRVL